MKKILSVWILVTAILTLTGCNKSPINLHDYSHKPSVEFQDNDDVNSFIDNILNSR